MGKISSSKLYDAGYEDAAGLLQFDGLTSQYKPVLPSDIQISKSRLTLEWKVEGALKQVKKVDAQALLKFIHLSSPELVVAFVEKYGCLEQLFVNKPEGWKSEAFEVYYQLARQLKAVLSIAADLGAGDTTSVSDWSDATAGVGDVRFWATGEYWDKPQPTRHRQQFELSRLINIYLLPQAYLLPQLDWAAQSHTEGKVPKEETPKLILSTYFFEAAKMFAMQQAADKAQLLKSVQTFEPRLCRFDLLPDHVKRSLPVRKRPSYLFSALIIELLATLSSPSKTLNVYRCTFPGCGNLHKTKRKPRGNTYCEDCKSEAHNLDNRNCYLRGK